MEAPAEDQSGQSEGADLVDAALVEIHEGIEEDDNDEEK